METTKQPIADNQPKHTQGEWRVTNDQRGTNIIDSNDEVLAGVYQRRNSDEEEANAERIVKCCNNEWKIDMHDVLMKFIKGIGQREEYADAVASAGMVDNAHIKLLRRLSEEAKQLLKQAEGK